MDRIISRINGDITTADQHTVRRFQPFHTGAVFFCLGSLRITGNHSAWSATTVTAAHKATKVIGLGFASVFTAAAYKQIDGAIGNLHIGACCYAVPFRFRFDGTSGNIDKAFFCIITVFTVNSILTCIYGQRSIRDSYTVVGIQTMGCRVHRISATREYEVILADDTVSCRGCHCQRTGAV